ncbi:Zinc dependent phospholipase C [Bremerella volcania]|uniref:Zinc dependent phospholipase C n=1 Tax=Bremerella volcania TaxID=2527984 RepID=A0A518C5D3_9BACT|nr:DUF4332 domain-containing protein [Bremerella volcania]QDU74437.1 Zinc dependent phospholipase C [Bremerella volcania]
MHLLFDILYAAHANGTHHKLAMDALNHLPAENSERRRNIFLKHYEPYLRGSKDPDKKFKDFRNHVLHPSQDYWGGAEKAARKWYDLLVEAIRAEKWQEVAYNAGVLSHYYSDPIMPFHTGSSQAENNIHRACEWSISCSYDRLRSAAELRGLPPVRMPSGKNWLEQMVRDGATKSHAHYQTLIDHYNFKLGRRNPPRGLDVNCRDVASEMIGYAIAGLAKILNRAFEEAAHEPPYVLLVVETVFATLEMPVQWVTNRMENAEQAELVRQMFREYQKTGKVERNLPEDVRVVRDELEADMNPDKPQEGERPLYEMPDLPEVSLSSLKLTGTRKTTIKPAPPKPSREIEEEKPKPRVSIPIPSYDEEDDPAPKPVAEKPKPPEPFQPVKGLTIRPKTPEPESEVEEDEIPVKRVQLTRPQPKIDPPKVESPRTEPAKVESPKVDFPPSVSIASREDEQPPVVEPPRERAIQEKKPIEDKPLKFYLNWEDPVVDAPSIGNKTAKRLGGVGIKTVAQLINADPKTVAPKLKAKHITPKLFAEWQAQAVLAYRIPMLRGHDAQLLTACGLKTPEDVAKASAKDLLAEVTEFAETTNGQRIIRSSDPPDLAEVTNWIAWARQARRSQAA